MNFWNKYKIPVITVGILLTVLFLLSVSFSNGCMLKSFNNSFGCGKSRVMVEGPDSSLVRYMDSITSVITFIVNRRNERYDSTINNANLGIRANEIIFRQMMSEFVKKQEKNRKLPFTQQWENYIKELEDE